MKKIAVVLLVSLFAVACTSTMTPGTGSTAAPGAQAARFDGSHYRYMNDPTAIREIDVLQPPRGLHVKASLGRSAFTWASKVDGKGQFCPEGKDWVTLNDGTFHAAGSGTPVAPYVVGCKTKGLFAPATRDVVLQ